jgi:dihydroneopterin triphosphate diphosphatase
MRQPCNVHVFVFRRTGPEPEYALFRRSDDGSWQSVAGGVEEDESLLQAARRETREESGLRVDGPLIKLDMESGVEKACFAAAALWPADLYIVRKSYFAIEVGTDGVLALSREHGEARWLPYEEAYRTLRYDDDRTALWELNVRIDRNDLPTAME